LLTFKAGLSSAREGWEDLSGGKFRGTEAALRRRLPSAKRKSPVREDAPGLIVTGDLGGGDATNRRHEHWEEEGVLATARK